MSEKKLADRIREAIRLRGYSYRTEKAYVHWYERYVRFHKLRHPSTMGAAEVEQFLIHLASQERVAASTQNPCIELVEVRPSAPSSSCIASSCRVGLRQKEIKLPLATGKDHAALAQDF